jgi:hypothetical protein
MILKISTKNCGLAGFNGAEMESAKAAGPQPGRQQREAHRIGAVELPVAILRLIIVLHDLLSLFDALGPFAVPQNGKISAQDTLFSDDTL